MDANSILNDPNYVPLARTGGDPLICEDGETFIIVSTTLRIRESYGRSKHWLSVSGPYVRGGGRP